MHAHATLTAQAAGDGRTVLTATRSQPPLTLRRVRAPGPGAEVCLVGSAAGPLGGDHLELAVTVGGGAALRLRSTSAQLVQPGRDGDPATTHTRASVEGHLAVALEPTVLVRGAVLHAATTLDLAPAASTHWQETTVLGRHGEVPGRARQHWRVTRGGRPLLCTTTSLLAEADYRSPALLGRASVLSTVLVVAPGLRPVARTRPGGAVHLLAEDAALVSVLAKDTVHAAHAVAELTEGWLP
ncbi:urease accessory protein [Crossiella equi]|uniref:Urease accessory protein UreD n=1 Tax=Crossiella equi TaxID=130796 RepID=A0ABS5AL86_9PSEU|nr:urease accessory protein UreD [Crossiella equi]MBP2477328.1 urease accessory protein [Crossiella equi]